MRSHGNCITSFLILFLGVLAAGSTFAQDKVTLSASADFVSRYIWRGANVNDAPNVQPSVSLGFKGLEAGLWGSSTLSANNTADDNYALSQEIDGWISYACSLPNGMEVKGLLTDYYYPNAGIKIGNFDNYDDANGPGAHLLEAGLVITGPDAIPLSISGFVNIYNDEGNNTYFQLDYSTEVSGTGLDLFAGAAGGSTKNPAYYGTEKFNFVNLGFKVTKPVKFSQNFSLPVSGTFILNPRTEIAFLVLGFSL